jgi:hypothetical protein
MNNSNTNISFGNRYVFLPYRTGIKPKELMLMFHKKDIPAEISCGYNKKYGVHTLIRTGKSICPMPWQKEFWLKSEMVISPYKTSAHKVLDAELYKNKGILNKLFKYFSGQGIKKRGKT